MMFPDEILLETFKYIYTNYPSLFSCLLVNRQWCRIIVPILWREPLKEFDDKRLIRIYLSALNSKEQASLIPFKIILPIYPRPLFDYASYTTYVGLNFCNGIINWLNSERHDIIIESRRYEDKVETAIKCSLIAMFLRKSKRLKYLEYEGIINKMIFENLRMNNTVIKLDLCLDNLDFENTKELSKFIIENTTLINLELSSNYFGPEGGKEIARALSINNGITKLKFRHNKIGSEGGEAFADALCKNNSLTSLDVRNNEIKFKGEEMAASLRRESANPALTTEIDMLLNRINHLERLDRLNRALNGNLHYLLIHVLFVSFWFSFWFLSSLL
ncbi:nucleotide-binding oligomerization domain-containing protein 2-like [Gigaspora margarita]|uniref:Nucleotide-binding oligomerization domain-containing protein 2-like n=1 Tax=Gigaspora margarita TaxID=4874 RepID=A0A8H4B357_GIGMA|nr:nucleotide-binding oligomerization domain-containing protein 2-like [Gigaspora margarita]